MSLPGELPTGIGQSAPLAKALAWSESGQRVALATVIQTWGSSPCPAGSQLAVDEHGHFEGSVSGGCVEAAVIACCQR